MKRPHSARSIIGTDGKTLYVAMRFANIFAMAGGVMPRAEKFGCGTPESGQGFGNQMFDFTEKRVIVDGGQTLFGG